MSCIRRCFTHRRNSLVRSERLFSRQGAVRGAAVRLHDLAPGAEQILMAVAKLAWDAQDPKDQAALARQLSVQELIPLLATKGLRQAPGGLVP